VQACGSAGTTAGLALGAKLSGLCPEVHGYMVCDDEAYFHDTINELYQQLGYTGARECGHCIPTGLPCGCVYMLSLNLPAVCLR
jgi:1-aminocyclopropane-1-carboxylate deaminase/D-cysteine desulfhydrase-like pyridoxal-dependent ACC family enzyme